jgi:hypothetical protein
MLPQYYNFYVLRVIKSDITAIQMSEVKKKILPHKVGLATLCDIIYIPKILLYFEIIFIGYITPRAQHVIQWHTFILMLLNLRILPP